MLARGRPHFSWALGFLEATQRENNQLQNTGAITEKHTNCLGKVQLFVIRETKEKIFLRVSFREKNIK